MKPLGEMSVQAGAIGPKNTDGRIGPVGSAVELMRLRESIHASSGDILKALREHSRRRRGPQRTRLGLAKALYEDPKRRAAREAETPLRRLGVPDDIGGVAVFLASPAGAFLTGQTLMVDGGVTAR